MLNSNFLKIGHRGACGYEPENTHRSFKKAIELGVDMVECDVWLTKDKKVVVIHDPTVNRTTSDKGEVSKLTLAEIREMDAGQGEKVLTLSELLDLARNHCQLNIEVKTKKVAEQLVEELKEADFPYEDLLISSNLIETIDHIKSQLPKLKTAWVFKAIENPPFYLRLIRKIYSLLMALQKRFPFLRLGWLFRLLTYPIGQLIWGMLMTGILPLTTFFIIEKLLAKKIETVCLYKMLATRGLIKRIHRYHKKVFVWTVNNKRQIEKYKRWGVDGIFCDYPDRL